MQRIFTKFTSLIATGLLAGLTGASAGAVPAIYNLGTLGGTESYGTAINASGQVAGYSYTTGNGAYHAFLYSGTPGSGGVMVDLGTLGGVSSFGIAINDSGQVAGDSDTSVGRDHAFLYSGTPGSGGTMADLGTLGGYLGSQGTAINASGQVVGYSYTFGYFDSQAHPFLYSGTPGSGGVMADLGSLGGTESFGSAINASGQVVGSSDITGDPTGHAFLYIGTPGVDGQMIDLDAWLKASNPTEGAKWTLTEADGLTDTGLITGTGIYNDGVPADSGTRAFILDASSLVPEPSGLALLLGLVTLTRLRRGGHRNKSDAQSTRRKIKNAIL
jgi:probable HAF family extracellular repeat protein